MNFKNTEWRKPSESAVDPLVHKHAWLASEDFPYHGERGVEN